jgi:hypothetical protein
MSKLETQNILALLVVIVIIFLVIFIGYKISYPLAPSKRLIRISSYQAGHHPHSSLLKAFVEDVNSYGLVVGNSSSPIEVTSFQAEKFPNNPELVLFTVVPVGWNTMNYLRWLMHQGGLKHLNRILMPHGVLVLPIALESASTTLKSSSIALESVPTTLESAATALESAPIALESASIALESVPITLESAATALESAPTALESSSAVGHLKILYATFSLADWNDLSSASQQSLQHFAYAKLLGSCLSSVEFKSFPQNSQVNEIREARHMISLFSHTSNLMTSLPSYAQVLFHQTQVGTLLNYHEAVDGYCINEGVKEFLWPAATIFYLHVYELSLIEFLSLGGWLEREYKKAVNYPQASLIQGFVWRQKYLGLVTRRPSIPLPDLLKEKNSTPPLRGVSFHLRPVPGALYEWQQRLRESQVDVTGYVQLFTGQPVVFSPQADILSAICASPLPHTNLKRRKPFHVAFVNVFSDELGETEACPIVFARSQKINLEGVFKIPKVFSGTFEQGYAGGWKSFSPPKTLDTCRPVNIHWEHLRVWIEHAQKGDIDLVYVGWTERGEIVAGTRNTFEDAHRCFNAVA